RLPRLAFDSRQRLAGHRCYGPGEPAGWPQSRRPGRWRHRTLRAPQPGHSLRPGRRRDDTTGARGDRVARPGRPDPSGDLAGASRLADRRAHHGRPGSMTTETFNTTLLFYPRKNPRLRLFALWYFTTLMI